MTVQLIAFYGIRRTPTNIALYHQHNDGGANRGQIKGLLEWTLVEPTSYTVLYSEQKSPSRTKIFQTSEYYLNQLRTVPDSLITKPLH